MKEPNKFFDTIAQFNPTIGAQATVSGAQGTVSGAQGTVPGAQGIFYSLPLLEKAGVGPVSRLPISIRLVLESVLRNCDGKRVSEQNVRVLANWKPNAPRTE